MLEGGIKSKMAAIQPEWEKLILKANFEADCFFLQFHPYLDAKKNDRKHWLQIRFFGKPKDLLPGSSVDKISQMDWEVIGCAESPIGTRYVLNFLDPLILLKGATKKERDLKVTVSQDFIHTIIANLFDVDDPKIINLLNDCIGFESLNFN
ncbi:hypothetical protein HOE22_06010 [Candidatus Woesearchaeota archaeon]|jgi:hypothetical protein|nr:hypothetical protein [Candidatus Woesearchaeota archaeon]MBT5528499.1 hypothetical protein [Cytophagia bacterium]MBT5991924.1 hypothetical protein [Bacteroidota bacterium]